MGRLFSAAASCIVVLGVAGACAESSDGRVQPASCGDRHRPRSENAERTKPARRRQHSRELPSRFSRSRARSSRPRQPRRDVGTPPPQVPEQQLQPAAASAMHHQRRGVECVPCFAGRRSAGGGAGADRHPAFRRGQSQPVFSARLQSRPRHRSRHHGRRHAGQHADPRPRPGLCRHQFPDSRTDPVGQCPQGSLLRRRGRFRLRRRAVGIDYINKLPKNIAEITIRQFRLSPRAGGGIDARSAPARCSRRSKASNTTARGMCRTTSASSTACCATARAPRPTASR